MDVIGTEILSRNLQDIGRECHLYHAAMYGSTAFTLERNEKRLVLVQIRLKDQADDTELAPITPEGHANVYAPGGTTGSLSSLQGSCWLLDPSNN
jgi:hypothetical protein